MVNVVVDGVLLATQRLAPLGIIMKTIFGVAVFVKMAASIIVPQIGHMKLMGVSWTRFMKMLVNGVFIMMEIYTHAVAPIAVIHTTVVHALKLSL